MAVRPRIAPPAPAAIEGVNFGKLDFYSGGFTLPAGRYALEFNVLNYTPTNQAGQAAGKPRLGVMLDAYPLDGGDAVQQFLSMGSKADQSFAPHPETGKGVVPIPGGPATTAPRNTNWNLFLKSLYDSGLPEGIFTNDLTTIDGIHVQTDLVPEPEERKGYGAKTGEAEEERKGSGMIPVVTEILDGGKPWEGTGGVPAAGAPVAAPKAASPAARPAPAKAAVRPGARPAAPAPAPVAEAADDDLMTAAINGITAVLEEPANANGCTKLKLRTGTFKAVNAAAGGEVAQAVIETYFSSDEALNSVLGQLGYGVSGINISPA